MQYSGGFGGGGGPQVINGATVTVTVSGTLTAQVSADIGNALSGTWTYNGVANVHIDHPDFGTQDQVLPVQGAGTIGGTLQQPVMNVTSGDIVNLTASMSSDGKTISASGTALAPGFGVIGVGGDMSGLPPVVQFQQASMQVTEDIDGGTAIGITLTKSFNANVFTRVHVSSSESLTATPGVDFVPIEQDVVFAPGEMTKVIALQVFPDTLQENNELITIRVTPVTFANIGATPIIQVTIVDDDASILRNLSPGPDNFLGADSNETINGLGGDDIIGGGRGNDIVNGGEGNDTIDWRPGDGNDIVDGGPGNDMVIIHLAPGVANTITVVRNPDGTVQITGAGGVQFSMHVDNVETLRFEGADGNDVINIGNLAGTDVTNTTVFAIAGAGNDTIDGAQLDKRLVADGGSGADTITGGTADDTLTGGTGNDTITGGLGIDTAVFSGLRSAYAVQPIANGVRVTGPDGIDTLTGVENLAFSDVTLLWQTSVLAFDFGLTNQARWIEGAGDFNRAGAGDLLVLEANTGAVNTILLQNGAQVGTGAVGVLSGGWQLAGTGDFTNDGTSDVLLLNANTREVNTWIVQNGQWSASGAVGILVGAWQLVGTGDFSNDGTTDVLLRNTATGEVATWIVKNGQWSASGAVGREVGGWQVIGTGDVNNDNTADVLLFNANTNEVNAWIVGNGQWAASTACGVLSGAWQVKGIGDFNGDGTGDVLLHNTSTAEVAAWLLQNGSWTASMSLGAYETASDPVAIGDFNSDGTSDLFWQNRTTGHAVEWLLP